MAADMAGLHAEDSDALHHGRVRAKNAAFLGAERAVLFEVDPGKARAIAREHLPIHLNSPYNIAKFRRPGYSEEGSPGGSNRIVDDLVFWGDLDTGV